MGATAVAVRKSFTMPRMGGGKIVFSWMGLALVAFPLAGYAGWAAGQLQAEISEGMWHVLPARYSDVFGGHPLELWRAVLRRQKGELAFFSTWMENPELN